jgi:hypothetical protein
VTNQVVYSDEEWGLLVGLPQTVALAASAVETDSAHKTQAEGSAGIEAIAAGRDSGSALVERVAHELVARVGDPEAGEEAPVFRVADPQAEVAEALKRAGAAAELLARKAGDGDAAAYKHWLVGIAESVVEAATSGGLLGLGSTLVSESERQFVDELSQLLQD